MNNSDLVAAVSAGEWDRQAITRAIEFIPEKLLEEYAGKLRDTREQAGTLHELRVIGKLLSRKLPEFRVVPYPDGVNFDALINVGSTSAELEITAFVEPAYDAAVGRVCQRIKSFLEETHPGLRYEVRLGNSGGGFVEVSNKKGQRQLDEEATYDLSRTQLNEAIGEDGRIREGWRENRDRGPVIAVRDSADLHVWQSSWQYPARVGVDQVRRKVRGKIRDNQWSGQKPGVLAVVLQHSPETRLLNEPGNSVCDEAFDQVPCLAAVVGLPFGNFLDRPVVYFPDAPRGLQVLDQKMQSTLSRAFRFWLGVNRKLAMAMLKHARQELKERGEWPGWRNARLA